MTVVDEYLSNVPAPQKAALERIRAIVRRMLPDAEIEEAISYGMPTLKYRGRNVLHFAVFKDHMSLFPTAGPTEVLQEQLKDFKTSKGTIQFTLEHPLPEPLIEEIVRLRVAEIEKK